MAARGPAAFAVAAREWPGLSGPWLRLSLLALLGVAASLLLALPHQLQDLDVYRAGGDALLHGRDPYQVVSGPSRLPFTYPPVAVVLAVPLALVPRWLAALALMAGGVGALGITARWLGLPVILTVAGTALLVEPVRSTFAYGQVNLLLLGLVVADLGRAAGSQVPGPRARGALTGLAAAVKLTPLIFLGWLVMTRQWRAAVNALGAFLAVGVLALALDPSASRDYWSTYWKDQTRIGSAAYGSNQALSGLLARSQHVAVPRDVASLAVTALLGLGGLTVAAAWARRERRLSLALAALTGLVISPVSWSHHWVWILPAAVLLARRAERGLREGGLLLLAVAVIGLPSWWDRGGNREYARGGWDLLFGETYLFAAVACLVIAGVALIKAPFGLRLPSIAS